MYLWKARRNLIISNDYFIKNGYNHRQSCTYFEDSLAITKGIVHQPDVYTLAEHLGRKFGCTHILDFGCGKGQKLIKLYPEFQLAGVDFGRNIDYCIKHYPFGQWFALDLELPNKDILPQEIMEKTLVVCSDVIEHLSNPTGLLQTLKYCLEHAPLIILSTPERDLVRGLSDMGPPTNPAHVREWNRKEFSNLLEAASFDVAFVGLTYNNDRDWEKKTILSLLHGKRVSCKKIEVPKSFRVVAFMTSYNEEDIIFNSVSRLIRSGVDVYLIDNWSTDKTVAAVEPLLGHGLIKIERFPESGSTGYYDWRRLLSRIEELSHSIPSSWFIHHDIDEIRESPWPKLTLREALYYVDIMGFNAIDHTIINFVPVDNCFKSGTDFGEYFMYWEFGKRAGHFQQIKTWKNFHQPLTLSCTGGHNVNFKGRKVFPYKFLTRHYPVRSQTHGEKKILIERRPRFTHEEHTELGWHCQYNHIEQGYNFLKDPQSLKYYDPNTFYQDYLVERISGIGIVRQEYTTIAKSKITGLFNWFKKFSKP
jgi:SAM-dependent methyltransferase